MTTTTEVTKDRRGCPVSTHGYGGYTRGCHCAICRAAKAAYMRTRRANARLLARRFTDDIGAHRASGITHGTVFGYEEAGCRCPECTAAKGAKRATERGRQRGRRAS